jgi:hypothetical protein
MGQNGSLLLLPIVDSDDTIYQADTPSRMQGLFLEVTRNSLVYSRNEKAMKWRLL